ncbi:MAG: hypothetical protein B5M56_07940 [Desulfococcus sp. 4484_241]|nr:MAG: hypothetical protein B5M56_07940 [Desulfococcus sp. 4484_241]
MGPFSGHCLAYGRKMTSKIADKVLKKCETGVVFSAGEQELIKKAYELLLKNPCENSTVACKAAMLLLEQKTEAVAVACALLAPLVWENSVSIEDVRKLVGREVASELAELRLSPVFLSGGPFTGSRKQVEKCLDILLAGMKRLLENNEIDGRVQGRRKSLHSILRKMRRTGKEPVEIMDRIGLRVIVNSVLDCYMVLGLIHLHFKPIPGTFDDYIGLPKENGYQSLHTCVYPVREISHKPIEFQIRTELMHMEAEYGAAAHWQYKSKNWAMEQNRIHRQWMEGLSRQYEQAGSTGEFIELLHRQVFTNHLVVFGNGGQIVRLGQNATVKDYLDITNTQAPKNSAIMVNGKRVGLDYRLKDGDSIEVRTEEGKTNYKTGVGAPYPFDLYMPGNP